MSLAQAVAAAWKEVLGIEQVGMNDNFFELGGHSVLVVRLHARLTEVLGPDLPIMDLFRFPTVEALVQAHGPARPPMEAPLSLQPLEDRVARQQEAMRRQREEALRGTRTAGGPW